MNDWHLGMFIQLGNFARIGSSAADPGGAPGARAPP